MVPVVYCFPHFRRQESSPSSGVSSPWFTLASVGTPTAAFLLAIRYGNTFTVGLKQLLQYCGKLICVRPNLAEVDPSQQRFKRQCSGPVPLANGSASGPALRDVNKVVKESRNSRNKGFSYKFCLMVRVRIRTSD
jgi:hypothetical protein